MVAPHAAEQRRENSGRAALAAGFTALVACTLLAVSHRGGASGLAQARTTALTGWLATGKAGEPKFYEPPAEAAAQGGESGWASVPFHSNGENYGTGSAAGPLDGKNVDMEVPHSLMDPKWAAREGREAAGHSLAQPFLVPLEAGGMPVPSAEVTPLGQYAPKTPQYTNPVAQFIPNVTYVENGDEVVGFEGPEDAAEVAAEEEEATTPEEVAAEQESGEEEPVAAEEKQLNLMKSALRQHSSAAMRIRSKIALLTRAVAHQKLQDQEQVCNSIRTLSRQIVEVDVHPCPNYRGAELTTETAGTDQAARAEPSCVCAWDAAHHFASVRGPGRSDSRCCSGHAAS